MRILLVAFAVLLALLVSTAATALPAPPPAGATLAQGTATHYYATSGVCQAEATFVVEYNIVHRTMVIASDTPCLGGDPYYATVGGCSGGPARDIRCDRTTATNDVHALLRTDGAFNLTWAGPGFYEAIEGQLQRTDA